MASEFTPQRIPYTYQGRAFVLVADRHHGFPSWWVEDGTGKCLTPRHFYGDGEAFADQVNSVTERQASND